MKIYFDNLLPAESNLKDLQTNEGRDYWLVSKGTILKSKLSRIGYTLDTIENISEPGCYFIDHLMDEAMKNPVHAPHLRVSKLEEYRGYGGVRLEDVVWITPDGDCVNFTQCPRTIAEVEHVMVGGNWPPTVDEAPELRRVNLTKTTTLLSGLSLK